MPTAECGPADLLVLRWRPIKTAPKEDGRVLLVWDGAVLGYPVAAVWKYDVVREKPPNWRKVPKSKWPVIACKHGEWASVEEDLMLNLLSCGGLNPTHWLPWKAPTEPTYSAWDFD